MSLINGWAQLMVYYAPYVLAVAGTIVCVAFIVELLRHKRPTHYKLKRSKL